MRSYIGGEEGGRGEILLERDEHKAVFFLGNT